MSGPVLTGQRPYRFLDETSVGNGYVRLRALALLPVILVVLFAVVLGFENSGYGAYEDRDTRDMTWDYRSTAPQSTSFHAYFRQAYWPSYLELEVNEEVYDEVVVAAEDRPVVLAAMPPTASCQRLVSVPCLADKPAHRDETTVGPLNLGTDTGIWAVGNDRAFQRIAEGNNVGLLANGVASVGNAYANAAELSAVMPTRLAELQEMRTKTANVLRNGTLAAEYELNCASDATGATCVWTQAQWDKWANLLFAELDTAMCDTEIDVCSQVSAALEAAAATTDNVGHVAARVVTGTWAATNVHLTSVVTDSGGLPLVTTVVNAGEGVLSVPDTASADYNPMTDTTEGEDTGYVPPASILAIVDNAVQNVASGVPLTGYVRPPDTVTQFTGLRKGVTVHAVECDLEKEYETSSVWRTRQGYEGTFYDIGIWPWEGNCGGTAHNVTVLTDTGVDLASFPAFNARDPVPAVDVVVLGKTKQVPAYSSFCDFDSADADAGADAVTCTVSVLVGVEISVAATFTTGEVLGGWRLVSVEGVYDDTTPVTTASTTSLNVAFSGTETAAIAAFGASTTREIYVTLRDAGAPEKMRASSLGTPTKMYLAIGLFFAFLVTLPIHPYLMFAHVKFNVAIHEGKPPPMWQAMRKFRGW